METLELNGFNIPKEFRIKYVVNETFRKGLKNKVNKIFLIKYFYYSKKCSIINSYREDLKFFSSKTKQVEILVLRTVCHPWVILVLLNLNKHDNVMT